VVETIKEIGQRVAANASVLLLADVLGKLIRATFAIYAARVLGVQRFGMYTLAVTFVFFFEFICRFGIVPMAVREIARHRGQVERFVSNILVLLLASAALASILIFFGMPLFNYQFEVRTLIYLLIPMLFANAFSSTFSTAVYGLENVRLPALISISSDLFSSSLGVLLLSLGCGLTAIVGVAVAVSLGNAAIAGSLIRRKFPATTLKIEPAFWGWLIRRSLPFGVLSLLIFVHDKVDILMLSTIQGPLEGPRAIGYYTPAYSILATLMILPVNLRTAMVPILASREDSIRVIRSTIEGSTKFLCTFLSFPIVIVSSFFAKDIVVLLFGEAYLPTADALRILGWAYALNAATAPTVTLLSISGRLWRFVPWALAIVFVNVLLNAFLIPSYSFIGAAVATLITETMAWSLRLYFVRQIAGIEFSDVKMLGHLLVPMSITFGLVFFIYSTYNLHPLLLALCALAVYSTALIGSKAYSKEELAMLKSILHRLFSAEALTFKR
jgi:O-antigen/teichoic acid export membrane protein